MTLMSRDSKIFVAGVTGATTVDKSLPDLILLLISAPVQGTINRELYSRPNLSAFTLPAVLPI